MIMTIKPKLGA